MANAMVNFGGNLHIVRTEYTERAVQTDHTMEAVVTGRREWTLEIGV